MPDRPRFPRRQPKDIGQTRTHQAGPPAEGGRREPWILLRTYNAHRAATKLTLLGVLAGVLLAVLGVPRVDLHGPLHFVGVMDPLCGGTRAAFLLAHGQWGGAWTYNPIVFPLAAGAVLLLCRAAVGVLTGRWLSLQISDRRPLIVLLVIGFTALEIRQQLRADLLMSAWTG